MDFKVEESSGNVFEDLNLSNPEERVAKTEICIQIRRAIQSRKLTQLQAAKLLGLEQSKVSLLMNGRVSGFSLEKLMELLVSLNFNIEIIISPTLDKGHVKVALA